MIKIDPKDYFDKSNKKYLSYHDIKHFQKCQFLYAEDKAGRKERVERDYFKLGHAFDSMLTGDFSQMFVVGKDPKKTLEQIRNARAKAEEGRKKYEGKTDKRSQLALAKCIMQIEELQAKSMELETDSDKEAITDTVYGHVSSMVKALDRQKLMELFPRDKKTNQHVIVTEIAGKKVKGMLDYFAKEKSIIVDYKTTAQMRTFDPAIYIGQLTWYRMLARYAYGIDCDCYLVVVDKDTYSKHSKFVMISKATMDNYENILLSAVEDIKTAEDLGIYYPAAWTNMHECYNCDHYNNCPHSVQTEFEVI